MAVTPSFRSAENASRSLSLSLAKTGMRYKRIKYDFQSSSLGFSVCSEPIHGNLTLHRPRQSEDSSCSLENCRQTLDTDCKSRGHEMKRKIWIGNKQSVSDLFCRRNYSNQRYQSVLCYALCAKRKFLASRIRQIARETKNRNVPRLQFHQASWRTSIHASPTNWNTQFLFFCLIVRRQRGTIAFSDFAFV